MLPLALLINRTILGIILCMTNQDTNTVAVPELGESLHPLIHAAPIAMVVVDSTGRILLVNAKLATLFGYQPEELQNQEIEFLLPQQLRQVHMQHRQGFLQSPHVREMGVGFDLVGRHKNGTLIPIEVGLGFGRLHKDVVTIASVIDISLRKQTESVLETRVKERTAELERLYEQIEQNAVAAERSRIAHDLHDSVTQTLFSASIIADILPRLWQRNSQEAERRLHELRELTRGALAEMRTLLLELRPTALNNVALTDLLHQLAEAVGGRSRVPIAVTIQGEEDLPVGVRVAFYRITQEALNNVAKHAEATHAAVFLTMTTERTEILIQDDGRGFQVNAIAGKCLGLNIMRERAEEIQARLSIQSQPGQGAIVHALWQRPEGTA